MATTKDEVRKEMKKKALTNIIKYEVHFRRSTLHLIKKTHRIYLSVINFTILEGHNLLDPDDEVAEAKMKVETNFKDVD